MRFEGCAGQDNRKASATKMPQWCLIECHNYYKVRVMNHRTIPDICIEIHGAVDRRSPSLIRSLTNELEAAILKDAPLAAAFDYLPGAVVPLPPGFIPDSSKINFGLPRGERMTASEIIARREAMLERGGDVPLTFANMPPSGDTAGLSGRPATIPAGAHVGICVGHSRPGDRGALAADGKTNEWNYNSRVARSLWNLLRAQGIKATVFDRYAGEGYGSAMTDIARQLKAAGCTMAVELHFNAYKEPGATVGRAKGFEVIEHTLKSALGAAMIGAMEQAKVGYRRGLKTPVNGRGDKFLTETHCHAALLEPFFADNPEEWARWGDKHDALAKVYFTGIVTYLVQSEVKK